jgi:hypothetical protein
MMNNLLLEMMAARASAQGNSEIANLVARLRAPGADSNKISQEMLAELGERNPAFAQLAKQLAESQSRKMIEVEATEEIPEAPAPAFDESAINELKTYATSLLSEVQALRDRADQLAAALGACCLCWGEDVSCRICRGRGAPGFALPDERLFEHYVLPAVVLLRGCKPRQRKDQAEVKQTGA